MVGPHINNPYKAGKKELQEVAVMLARASSFYSYFARFYGKTHNCVKSNNELGMFMSDTIQV